MSIEASSSSNNHIYGSFELYGQKHEIEVDPRLDPITDRNTRNRVVITQLHEVFASTMFQIHEEKSACRNELSQLKPLKEDWAEYIQTNVQKIDALFQKVINHINDLSQNVYDFDNGNLPISDEQFADLFNRCTEADQSIMSDISTIRMLRKETVSEVKRGQLSFKVQRVATPILTKLFEQARTTQPRPLFSARVADHMMS